MIFIRRLLPLLFLLISHSSTAQEFTEPYQSFGDYTVYFTVFNSAFIPPDIAKANNLTRAKDRVLVNVSLVKKGSLGLPATVEGTASNLMQQSKTLDFIEISEGNATYYIASLFHINEEVINFSIDVTPEGESNSHTVTFTKKLYQD